MTTQEIAEALEDWATTVVSGLNAHHLQPEELSKNWPLVLADPQQKRRVSGDEQPRRRYQQVLLDLWEVDLNILVAPESSATEQLRDIVDTLGDALLTSALEGVQFTSPEFDAELNQVIDYPDSTTARSATLTVTVGEQVPVGKRT